jgi:hypothetical protein
LGCMVARIEDTRYHENEYACDPGRIRKQSSGGRTDKLYEVNSRYDGDALDPPRAQKIFRGENRALRGSHLRIVGDQHVADPVL